MSAIQCYLCKCFLQTTVFLPELNVCKFSYTWQGPHLNDPLLHWPAVIQVTVCHWHKYRCPLGSVHDIGTHPSNIPNWKTWCASKALSIVPLTRIFLRTSISKYFKRVSRILAMYISKIWTILFWQNLRRTVWTICQKSLWTPISNKQAVLHSKMSNGSVLSM